MIWFFFAASENVVVNLPQSTDINIAKHVRLLQKDTESGNKCRRSKSVTFMQA